MQEDLITFDIEWLSLPKGEFRMLVMIADIGGDIRCLSNACRYFGVRDDETSTKDKMKEDLQSLVDKGIINLTKIKRRYYATLNPIAKENIITIKREYLKTIMQRNYEAKVAWEQVLKCYLWIDSKTKPDLIFTNDEMVAAMNISSSTISKAKSPLKNEYQAVKIKKITDKIGNNNYRTIGQTAEVSAWWNT